MKKIIFTCMLSVIVLWGSTLFEKCAEGNVEACKSCIDDMDTIREDIIVVRSSYYQKTLEENKLALKKCAESDAEACNFLLDRVKKMAKDISGFSKDCETDGEIVACIFVAPAYFGMGEVKKAIELNRKNCANSDLIDNLGTTIFGCEGFTPEEVCSIFGNKKVCRDIFLQEAKNAGEDIAKAKGFYEKACDKEHPDACLWIAQSYNVGRGVSQDITKAKEFYKKACDLKHQFACGIFERLNQ